MLVAQLENTSEQRAAPRLQVRLRLDEVQVEWDRGRYLAFQQQEQVERRCIPGDHDASQL